MFRVASILVLLCLLSDTASCQQQTVTVAVNELPDTPQAKGDLQNRAEQQPAEGTASVSGVVQDASGAPVVGAEVSLTSARSVRFRSALSGANGEFEFIKLPSGSYVLTVGVKGFDTITSKEFVLGAQQAYVVPNIVIAISASRTEVLVRPTEEIAAEQIAAEEKQRVFGVIPNFYTSYVWDAAPMTAKQKFSLAAHSAFDPVSLLGVGVTAGIEQATNAFSGYGQGASGYAKRFGATFAQERTSIFFSHAVFPSIFHQDPRYFYQGSGSVKSRLSHAVASAFVARSDSGGRMPNYSYVLGVMTSGAISNLYYPPADRGPGLVFTNTAIGLGARVGGNIFREFLLKKLTKNVPANGKP
ncbi:MAG TPA: carboxypeptidase-like regulatory domain-containing protein [Candidatus Dormibacteraeota bacterium]|nr:carboxypeptidase-like regulatory domain-containing protein [Candidatus Dormibacteraeota bacterium]